MCLSLCPVFVPDTNAETGKTITPHARNVILFIGDGMDDHQITIARNYLKGVNGRLIIDQLPVRSAVQVLTIDESDPTLPLYVADSACSGTAMSTGRVTSRGRVGTTARTDEDLETITELAHKAGFKTGLVTPSDITDATPAVFAAHISYRFCKNPEAMQTERFECLKDKKSNGGPGSISEQLAVSGLDVILGGGHKNFKLNVEGGSTSVQQLAEKSGFTTLITEQDLNNASVNSRWLGLFAEGNLEPLLMGENGRTAEKPDTSMIDAQPGIPGTVKLPKPMTCEKNPKADSNPSLKLMTQRAIEQLSHGNEKGFFLMVESALIDKQSHARNACGSIGEVGQLDEALAYVLSFAKANPETLILVTADHSQAAQLVPAESLFAASSIPVYTPGKMVRIRMPDGSVMGINYATNDFYAEEHTGAAVPLFANDIGRDLILPLIAQPQIYEIARRFLQL